MIHMTAAEMSRLKQSGLTLTRTKGETAFRLLKEKAGTSALIEQLAKHGVTGLVRQHRFHEGRRWAFDLASLEWKLAIEIQGVDHRRRGHQSVKGFKNDCQKFSAAFGMGWTVVPILHSMIADGSACELIASGLKQRGFM